MHKPTDEYFNRYERFFSSSKFHFTKLNVIEEDLYLKLR